MILASLATPRSSRDLRHSIEYQLLLGLCFVLPLLEAPKNILWVAYGVTWIVNRVRTRDFGGPWDLWDTLIAGWIASGFLAAAFSGLHGEEWQGAGDLLRYGSVLWMVKRSGYRLRELRYAIGTLIASTLIGIAAGYVRIWTGMSKDSTLQLHSVGHVNHTAIYLAIMLGVCFAWLFSEWRNWRGGTRALGTAVTALVLVSLIDTASRAAIGVSLLMVPLLAVAWWPRWRLLAGAAAMGAAVVATAAILLKAEVVRKQEQNEAANNVLSYRDAIWRTGLAAWERYPVFGVGMDNYSGITLARVREWRERAGKSYDSREYLQTSHAHSLYVNTLAERGIVGLAALGTVLAAWIAWLIRYRPRRESPDYYYLLWGSSAAAWFVTAFVGLVNTTLHHEHGLLGTLLLAMWLCCLEPASRPSVSVQAHLP